MLAVENYWLASDAVANGKARSRQDGFVPEAKVDLGGMIGWLEGPCVLAVIQMHDAALPHTIISPECKPP